MASRPNRQPVELGLAEHVCLALVSDGLSHGWAVGGVLAPDGELGRIWSLSRPLTYRAIDQLADKGMITRTGTTAGRGRDRRTIAATPAGRRASRRWLDEPVEHLRDVRTELLLKLALRDRAGLARAPLLDAQADAFAPVIESLTQVRTPDLVALWRREHARAVRRFLRAALATEPTGDTKHHSAAVEPTATLNSLSARNQLRATITSVSFGDMLCTVRAVLGDGQTTSATVTRDAAEELDLTEGDEILMISKSTETMVALIAPDEPFSG
jgi:molybdopterin-binding protein